MKHRKVAFTVDNLSFIPRLYSAKMYVMHATFVVLLNHQHILSLFLQYYFESDHAKIKYSLTILFLKLSLLQ